MSSDQVMIKRQSSEITACPSCQLGEVVESHQDRDKIVTQMFTPEA